MEFDFGCFMVGRNISLWRRIESHSFHLWRCHPSTFIRIQLLSLLWLWPSIVSSYCGVDLRFHSPLSFINFSITALSIFFQAIIAFKSLSSLVGLREQMPSAATLWLDLSVCGFRTFFAMIVAQCPVCQELFMPGSDCFMTALPCGHVFHKKCVERWFSASLTCPQCRVIVKRSTTISRLFFDVVPFPSLESSSAACSASPSPSVRWDLNWYFSSCFGPLLGFNLFYGGNPNNVVDYFQ